MNYVVHDFQLLINIIFFSFQFNGNPVPNQPYVPHSYPMLQGNMPPLPNGPPVGHYLPGAHHEPAGPGPHQMNGVHQYGHPPVGPPQQQPQQQQQPPPPQFHHMRGPPMPPGAPAATPASQHSSYHDKPPLLQIIYFLKKSKRNVFLSRVYYFSCKYFLKK